MIYQNMWRYQNVEVTELPECFGFVYIIENLITGRKYIGKKQALMTKTTYKMVTDRKGVKKKKKISRQVPSDWRSYYGSNQELIGDVKRLGAENFSREILFYAPKAGILTYIESREQFSRRVLETDDYYNGLISCKISGSNVRNKVIP